ncbi:MAG: hypothetical protein A2X12_04390 [Bacteroidetes bacterium GWE2_29_8]|nr:MAG: hypothetical protein A2X12_04390 [Bacteroidetes bacterium GWE2_29_8]OFY18044.1 MAG: hypothetical protein A2X02_09770 [Bacteroidetes bacterium GWF2_29_10]
MKKIFNLLLLSFLFIVNISAYSNELPERPNPPKLVNDFSAILNSEDRNYLENKLRAYNDSTSTQIVVVITEDLLEYDKADYAYQIGEKWGVGQKGKDNGLIILIKPSGKQGERGVFIATGYGLESILTDAICKRIIEKEMIPEFKNGNIFGGIDKSTNIIIGLLSGSFTGEKYMKKEKGFSIFYLIPFVLLIFFAKFMSVRSSHLGNKGNLSFWTLLFLMSSMNNSSGSYRDFSSGRGGFGGGGSSGFGGFGGGGFGGGGAGGSW